MCGSRTYLGAPQGSTSSVPRSKTGEFSYMKKITVVALILLLSVAAFGAANGEKIELRKDMTLNGTKLLAGEYRVTVDGAAGDVKVTFTQGKKVVATANGKIEGTVAPTFNSVVTTQKDGVAVVKEIQLKQVKGSVVIQ